MLFFCCLFAAAVLQLSGLLILLVPMWFSHQCLFRLVDLLVSSEFVVRKICVCVHEEDSSTYVLFEQQLRRFLDIRPYVVRYHVPCHLVLLSLPPYPRDVRVWKNVFFVAGSCGPYVPDAGMKQLRSPDYSRLRNYCTRRHVLLAMTQLCALADARVDPKCYVASILLATICMLCASGLYFPSNQ